MTNAVKKACSKLKDDEATGANIIIKALSAPIRQIAENAGVDAGVVVSTIQNSDVENYGYDAAKDTYVNMIDAGILDPAKVCRSALQNATSIASTLLTTEALVTDIPELNSNPMPQGGMGGDMY